MTSATWAASSRVGVRARTVGRFDLARLLERQAIAGSANARVLPEPVAAWAATSRPASAAGTTSAWMAKGAS